MAEEPSQSTSTGTKHAQPHDSDAQVQAAPDNSLSEPFDSHSPGRFTTMEGATIHPIPKEKEDENP
jgi:hypothetical protein